MGLESATPWGAAASGLETILGGIQYFSNAKKAKKTERKLEGMIDAYKPNQGIMSYYSKALQRYNSNPYQSTTYQTQAQNAGRTTATGLGALQGRRSAVGGISRLAGIQNDAMLKAGMGAEAEQGQRLNQLGQATSMKAQEDKYKFEGKYNLLSLKAGAANATANTGISNVFNGLGGLADTANIDTMYGDNTGRKRKRSIDYSSV